MSTAQTMMIVTNRVQRDPELTLTSGPLDGRFCIGNDNRSTNLEVMMFVRRHRHVIYARPLDGF